MHAKFKKISNNNLLYPCNVMLLKENNYTIIIIIIMITIILYSKDKNIMLIIDQLAPFDP